VGLIAGLLMAPIAVACAWSLTRVLAALARLALRWASPASRPHAGSARAPGARAPFDIEAQDEVAAADERIAA
jgi:hypothetical protein